MYVYGSFVMITFDEHFYLIKYHSILFQVLFFPDKAIACRDFFETVEGCPRKLSCSFSHETTNLRQVYIICLNLSGSMQIVTSPNAKDPLSISQE